VPAHYGISPDPNFYGFAICNALINPNNPAIKRVLRTMVETGDCFFFALDSERSATAFRSGIGTDSLAGLKANMARLEVSTTTEAQYRSAVAQFAENP